MFSLPCRKACAQRYASPWSALGHNPTTVVVVKYPALASIVTSTRRPASLCDSRSARARFQRTSSDGIGRALITDYVSR